MATQREDSRKPWLSAGTREDINSGSFQRIADAVEKMAGNYTQLQNDRDRYEKYYREGMATNAKLYKRIESLRGVVIRQRNKLKAK